MRFLDRLRTLDDAANFSEMPGSPSAKSVETPSKPSIDTFDTAPTGPFQKIHGFDLPELKAAAGDDWPELEANPEALDAFALALSIRWQREGGERPESYTQTAICDGCGPVWLWPGAPARVIACPWCFNVAAGKPVPRPPQPAQTAPAAPVTCANCGHFEPNTVGSSAGIGRCRIGAPASRRTPALWPNAEHPCRDWRPSQ
ncbi:hypothetical protein [uncultured Thiohalocapsa sp.]|uniref:hypothetical protein n=1 Tax=uncultured Thiohalocapsa sp. TaxID=768990 RepID=UPI0025D3071A|nr:hypothetical protein [uncultured Thiohalocapsa sp.]